MASLKNFLKLTKENEAKLKDGKRYQIYSEYTTPFQLIRYFIGTGRKENILTIPEFYVAAFSTSFFSSEVYTKMFPVLSACIYRRTSKKKENLFVEERKR